MMNEDMPRPNSTFDVLIVGAGHGGAQTAIALRQRHFEGSVLLIGDEPHLPYERPPLSKEYLGGDKPFDRILIRPAPFWEERAISLRSGARVAEVDPDARCVTTTTGDRIGYNALVWATGGTARPLPCEGGRLAGVHTIRARTDVDALATELPAVHRVVVVGGGFIGLEAAAVLSKMGKRVTVVEALDRVLARVAGEPLSRFFEDLHRAHGIELRLSVGVDKVLGDRRVTGVRLTDGETLRADMVIVGIGITPEIAPLIAAGAETANGARIDASCRTSLPNVYAVGDCALHRNRFANDREVRIESVQNATDQAVVVARNIVGEPATYDAVPWFWSNQFDIRLQTIGLSQGYDRTIVRGDPASQKFSVVYLNDHRVVALDCVNSPKDYVQGKSLIISGAVVNPALLANKDIALRELC